MFRQVVFLMLAAVLTPHATSAADIGQRTAVVCISQESKSLVTNPGYAANTKRDQTISSFTQWMFEAEKSPRPLQIRFLWIPPTASTPPELKISTTDSRHGVVRLLSQTRHGILVATSASIKDTNIGWMFAINFKAEQVVSTSVYSNFGGGRGRAFSYSCQFDNDTPRVDPPGTGAGVG